MRLESICNDDIWARQSLGWGCVWACSKYSSIPLKCSKWIQTYAQVNTSHHNLIHISHTTESLAMPKLTEPFAHAMKYDCFSRYQYHLIAICHYLFWIGHFFAFHLVKIAFMHSHWNMNNTFPFDANHWIQFWVEGVLLHFIRLFAFCSHCILTGPTESSVSNCKYLILKWVFFFGLIHGNKCIKVKKKSFKGT